MSVLKTTRHSKLVSLVIPALAAALLGSCDSGAAGGSDAVTAAGGVASSNGKPVVGESCVSSDPNKICLAIHFVSYKDSKGNPVASESQVATIVSTMNGIWQQCGIGFQVEAYEAIDPTKYGLAYGADAQNQLDQIRQTFAQPTNMLLGVTTGPWGATKNAWTNMPGDNVYGAIMEASIVDYGNGIIYAHEFGHYLGLDHVPDTSDLMDAIIYTDSNKLTSDQCATAQQTAKSYWAAMLRH